MATAHLTAVLLTAVCVLADTSGDDAAVRKLFSISVSSEPMPQESHASASQSAAGGFAQGQQPTFGASGMNQQAPVTNVGAGAWPDLDPPAKLEPKGPPAFMPDAPGSVDVPAMAAPPTTMTTTGPPGLLSALMPLISGGKKMVGQAEQGAQKAWQKSGAQKLLEKSGAQKLLHLPKDNALPSSQHIPASAEIPASAAALQAQTSKAQQRLQIANQQAAELKAQLAAVKAKLNERSQQSAAQQPTQTRPPPPAQPSPVVDPVRAPLTTTVTQKPVETTQKVTLSHLLGSDTAATAKDVPQQRMQTSTEPPKAKSTASPVEAKQEAQKPKEASQKSKGEAKHSKSKSAESEQAEAPKKKAGDKEKDKDEEKHKHKEKSKDDEKARLKAFAAAMGGSQKKFLATPTIVAPSSQGNILGLCFALIVASAVLTLVARSTRARGLGPIATDVDHSHESEDSGIE